MRSASMHGPDTLGHVFQERFKSFPIESDAYLLEAVRYVHNNPREGRHLSC